MTSTSRRITFGNSFVELLTKNLGRRATVYVAYALLAWFMTSVLSARAFESPPSVRTTVACAFVCVVGGALSFVLIAVFRRMGLWGIPEYVAASLGRTGVPCLLVLICLIRMDELRFRTTVLEILVVYVMTAPLHVWLTIPPEIDFQEGYTRSMDRRQN